MRAARTITHDEMTLTIAQWSKRTGISRQTILNRIDAGWPIEQALSRPVHKCGRPTLAAQRLDRVLQTRAIQIQREFSKLVFDMDKALRTFSEKLHTLLPNEDTPGVGQQPADDRPDRTIPTAQDSR